MYCILNLVAQSSNLRQRFWGQSPYKPADFTISQLQRHYKYGLITLQI